MPCFPQPAVRVQPDGLYELTEDYRYRAFLIPSGFRWDGASVPRLFWTLTGVRPGGRILGASCIHDALYRYGGEVPVSWNDPIRYWSRKEADQLFRKMMKGAGIGWLQCHRAYWAVRMFGGRSWKDGG